MLAPGQNINDLKNGLVNERYRWSGNEVPYVFEDGFSKFRFYSLYLKEVRFKSLLTNSNKCGAISTP